ncbi:hypothetical protein [Aurantiacibacter luteus]|nr:hypothetical protein [Aurantiacibacter luteus]
MNLARKTILLLALAVLAGVLVIAWYDGGQQEQRMIVEPVAVSESAS